MNQKEDYFFEFNTHKETDYKCKYMHLILLFVLNYMYINMYRNGLQYENYRKNIKLSSISQGLEFLVKPAQLIILFNINMPLSEIYIHLKENKLPEM